MIRSISSRAFTFRSEFSLGAVSASFHTVTPILKACFPLICAIGDVDLCHTSLLAQCLSVLMILSLPIHHLCLTHLLEPFKAISFVCCVSLILCLLGESDCLLVCDCLFTCLALCIMKISIGRILYFWSVLNRR